jgi:hypothetical protein
VNRDDVTARPSPEMMAPVRGVADFMQSIDLSGVTHLFAERDVVVVENFAPFVFRGDDCVKRWATAFAEHAAALSELRAEFGPAQDFARSGDRAFFTLPTTWTGLEGGRRFVETGALTFVLVRHDRGWRIACYAWGVTGMQYV